MPHYTVKLINKKNLRKLIHIYAPSIKDAEKELEKYNLNIVDITRYSEFEPCSTPIAKYLKSLEAEEYFKNED